MYALRGRDRFYSRDPMSIPARMKVNEVRAIGPPSNLVLGEWPVPSPDPDEVLVKVAAAGVNRVDAMQRGGDYPPPPGACDAAKRFAPVVHERFPLAAAADAHAVMEASTHIGKLLLVT